jgi:glutaredoxin 2
MLDSLFNSPSANLQEIQRDPREQESVDDETKHLALYHYESCIFSARVRRAIQILSLKIETKDILKSDSYYQDLQKHCGKTTVPCLRILEPKTGSLTWMFESADIIAYLVQRFGEP